MKNDNRKPQTMKATAVRPLPALRSFRKDQRIRTKAGKIAYVLEDSEGMAIVNVRFLDKSTGQIPARFILEDR